MGVATDFSGVLETNLDPQQWALELERVTPKLKVIADSASQGKEWVLCFKLIKTRTIFIIFHFKALM